MTELIVDSLGVDWWDTIQKSRGTCWGIVLRRKQPDTIVCGMDEPDDALEHLREVNEFTAKH